MAANPALDYAEILDSPSDAQTLFSTPGDVQLQPSTGVGCVQPHVIASSTLVVDATPARHCLDPLGDVFLELCGGMFGEGSAVKLIPRTWGQFFRFAEAALEPERELALANVPLLFVVFSHPSFAEALTTCLWGAGGNVGAPTLKLAELEARLPAASHAWFDRCLKGVKYHAAWSGPTSARDSSGLAIFHNLYLREYFPSHPFAPKTFPSSRAVQNLPRHMIPTKVSEAFKCLCVLMRSVMWDMRSTQTDLEQATEQPDDDVIKTPFHKSLKKKTDNSFSRLRRDRTRLDRLLAVLHGWDGVWDADAVHFFPVGFVAAVSLTLGNLGPNEHLHDTVRALLSTQQARTHMLHRGALVLRLIPADRAVPTDNPGAAALLALFVDQPRHVVVPDANDNSEWTNMAGIDDVNDMDYGLNMDGAGDVGSPAGVASSNAGAEKEYDSFETSTFCSSTSSACLADEESGAAKGPHVSPILEGLDGQDPAPLLAMPAPAPLFNEPQDGPAPPAPGSARAPLGIVNDRRANAASGPVRPAEARKHRRSDTPYSVRPNRA